MRPGERPDATLSFRVLYDFGLLRRPRDLRRRAMLNHLLSPACATALGAVAWV